MFSGTKRHNSTFFNVTDSEWEYANHTLAWTTYTGGRWINRTDRAVTFESVLESTYHCAPLFKLPLIRERHYTQRYMETLPEICPGFNMSTVLNTSTFTYQAVSGGGKNNTSVVFSSKSDVSHQISSFWMDQGTYD